MSRAGFTRNQAEQFEAIGISCAMCELIESHAGSKATTVQALLGHGRITHTSYMIVSKGIRPFSLTEILVLAKACGVTPHGFISKAFQYMSEGKAAE
jgi:hypothetical protein